MLSEHQPSRLLYWFCWTIVGKYNLQFGQLHFVIWDKYILEFETVAMFGSVGEYKVQMKDDFTCIALSWGPHHNIQMADCSQNWTLFPVLAETQLFVEKWKSWTRKGFCSCLSVSFWKRDWGRISANPLTNTGIYERKNNLNERLF